MLYLVVGGGGGAIIRRNGEDAELLKLYDVRNFL